MICQKCGSENQEGKKFCGDCGAGFNIKRDVKTNENDIQDKEDLSGFETLSAGDNLSSDMSNIKTNKKKKTAILILSITAFLVVVGSITGVYFYNKYQTEKAAELKQMQEAHYETDLRNVVIEILGQSSKVENMVGTYSDIWRKIIESDYSNRVIIKGKTVYDFSTGLALQTEVFKDDESIDKIKNGKSSIESKMRTLNQPPEKYKDLYNIVFELYGYYTEYEAMAESPSGSLVTFNQKAGDLSSKIVKKINEFQVKIPIK